MGEAQNKSDCRGLSPIYVNVVPQKYAKTMITIPSPIYEKYNPPFRLKIKKIPPTKGRRDKRVPPPKNKPQISQSQRVKSINTKKPMIEPPIASCAIATPFTR